MKYWVRAIGNTINEQLLVSATSEPELRVELSSLLQIKVLSTTLTTQRIQHILKAEDRSTLITTVEVETELDRLEKQFCGPGVTGGSDPTDNMSNSGGGGGGSVSRSGVTVELSLTGTSDDLLLANNSSFGQGDAISSPQAAMMMFGASPTSMAMLKKITLSRERVTKLIDTNYKDAFYSAVRGCLVRLRNKSGTGYIVATIVAIESSHQLLLDFAYFMELRHTDSVSNGKPKHDELKEWFRLHMREPLQAAASTPKGMGALHHHAELSDDVDGEATGLTNTMTPPPAPLLVPADIEGKADQVAAAEAQISRLAEMRSSTSEDVMLSAAEHLGRTSAAAADGKSSPLTNIGPPPPPPPAHTAGAWLLSPRGGSGGSHSGGASKEATPRHSAAKLRAVLGDTHHPLRRELDEEPPEEAQEGVMVPSHLSPATMMIGGDEILQEGGAGPTKQGEPPLPPAPELIVFQGGLIPTPGRPRRRSSITSLPAGSGDLPPTPASGRNRSQSLEVSPLHCQSDTSHLEVDRVGGPQEHSTPSPQMPRRRRSSEMMVGDSPPGVLFETEKNTKKQQEEEEFIHYNDDSKPTERSAHRVQRRRSLSTSSLPPQHTVTDTPTAAAIVRGDGIGPSLQRKPTGMNLRAVRTRSDSFRNNTTSSEGGLVAGDEEAEGVPSPSSSRTSRRSSTSFHHLGDALQTTNGVVASHGVGAAGGAGGAAMVESRLVPTTITGSHTFTTRGADVLANHSILIASTSSNNASGGGPQEANEIGNFMFARRTSCQHKVTTTSCATRVRLPPSFSTKAVASHSTSALVRALGPETMDLTRRGFVTHGAPVKWRGFFWLLATVPGLPGRFFLLGSDALCAHFGTQVRPIEIEVPNPTSDAPSWWNTVGRRRSSRCHHGKKNMRKKNNTSVLHLEEHEDAVDDGVEDEEPVPPREDSGVWCQLVASDHHNRSCTTPHKGLYLLWSVPLLGTGMAGIAVAVTKEDHLTNSSRWEMVTNSGPLTTIEMDSRSAAGGSSSSSIINGGESTVVSPANPVHLHFVEHFVAAEGSTAMAKDLGCKSTAANHSSSSTQQQASTRSGSSSSRGVEFLSVPDPTVSGWIMAKAHGAETRSSSSEQTPLDVSSTLLSFLPYSDLLLLGVADTNVSVNQVAGDAGGDNHRWSSLTGFLLPAAQSPYHWKPLLLPRGTVTLGGSLRSSGGGGGGGQQTQQQLSLCHAGHHILLFRLFVNPFQQQRGEVEEGEVGEDEAGFKYTLVWLIL